ncbi:MAG: sigma-70 family RNA polymerase sigma factor [Acidobacteriota bacterium]
MTDESTDPTTLVVAARDGDAAAFAMLYRRFGRLVHAVLLSRLPPDDAADLTQDVFTQAWSRLHTLRKPSAFAGWVAAIARRRAADHLRSRIPHDELDDGLPEAERQTGTLQAREVLAAIRSLPETYRETLLLRLVEGHSGPEIATLTGLTPGSVRVNLHRGFKLLRQRLGACT